jgi:hypothetical protein
VSSLRRWKRIDKTLHPSTVYYNLLRKSSRGGKARLWLAFGGVQGKRRFKEKAVYQGKKISILFILFTRL